MGFEDSQFDDDILVRSLSTIKRKYNDLDFTYKSIERLKGEGTELRFLFFINLTWILEKTTKTLYDPKGNDKTSEFIVAIELMNIVAHYRHYIHSRHKSKSTFVLYYENEKEYIQYENLSKILRAIILNVPDVLFVTKIASSNTKIYNHLVTSISKLMGTKYSKEHSKLVITTISGYTIDDHTLFSGDYSIRMFIPLFVKKWVALGRRYIISNLLENNKVCPVEEIKSFVSKYTKELETLYDIIKITLGIIPHYKPLPSMMKKRKTLRIPFNQFKSFLDDNIDLHGKELIEKFIREFIDVQDHTICTMYMNDLSYDYNTEVLKYTGELMNTWSIKITDKDFDEINEKLTTSFKNQLKVPWLLEN